MNETDADLSDVVALQRGDEQALDRLMARHKDPLYRFICGRVHDREDAYEVLADTFVRVYRKRGKFIPTGKFSSWLYRIALNLCRDYSRKHRRSPLGLCAYFADIFPAIDSAALIPDSDPNPLENIASREAMAALQKLIEELPEKLRSALVLNLVDERPQSECAELLDVTVKTVETRVYRARRLLKKRLREDEEMDAHIPWAASAALR